MTSMLLSTSNARKVISPRLPMGVGTRYKEIFLSNLCEFVYCVRELSIEVCYFVPCIMRVELKVNGVVRVCPRGMVVHFFRHQCHLCHKSECFFEVFELK